MRFVFAVLLLCVSGLSQALTPAAREFLEISRKLEPVQCEKRQLRRVMALAQVEGRAEDRRKAERRFAALNRQPETARLEKRLGQLEPLIEKSTDPEDLNTISLQRREAFYRCD